MSDSNDFLKKLHEQTSEISAPKEKKDKAIMKVLGSWIVKRTPEYLKATDNGMSDVMMRYGTGQIPKDVYELTKKNLDKEIDDLSVQVLKLEDNSSNHVSEVNRVILTACKLKTLWKNGSYKNRQNLQKLVFPDGLIWDKETDKTRTIRENEAFKFMRSLSSTYEKLSKEKSGKSFDFSGLVAEAGLEPTTSGL